MKKITFAVCMVLCAALILGGCSFGKDASVKMTVNGDEVLASQYNIVYAMLAMNYESYYGDNWAAETYDSESGQTNGEKVAEDAKEQVASFIIQAQKAAEAGISATSSEINAQKTAFKKAFGSQLAYNNFIEKYDVTTSALNTYCEWSVLSQKLSEQYTAPEEVTDADIQETYLDKNFRVKYIFISSAYVPEETEEAVEEPAEIAGDIAIDEIAADGEIEVVDESVEAVEEEAEEVDTAALEEAAKAAALEKANAAHDALAAGTAFETVAAQYNEDESEDIENGILWNEDSVYEEIADAALALESGQYSDVIEISGGYFIVYKCDFTDEDIESFKQSYKDNYYTDVILAAWLEEAEIVEK